MNVTARARRRSIGADADAANAAGAGAARPGSEGVPPAPPAARPPGRRISPVAADAVVSSEDLAHRRAIAEERVAALRRARADARLDGAVFDDEALTGAEREADVLADAIVAFAERSRAAETAAGEARRRDLGIALHAAEAERVAAIDRAETAARTMTAALADTFAAVHRARGLCAQLGAAPPVGLLATGARVAERLCALLLTLPQGPGGLGPKLSCGSPMWPAAEGWAEREVAAVQADIDAITRT